MKPKISPNCGVNLFAAPDERIIEFSTPHGGGLISIRDDDERGIVTVDVYRCDDTVRVLGPQVTRKTICQMCGGTIAVLDNDEDGTPIWCHVDDTGCDDPVEANAVTDMTDDEYRAWYAAQCERLDL